MQLNQEDSGQNIEQKTTYNPESKRTKEGESKDERSKIFIKKDRNSFPFAISIKMQIMIKSGDFFFKMFFPINCYWYVESTPS